MDYFKVKKTLALNGTVNISGAKNATLPLLFSSLLAEGKHRFNNIPNLEDVHLSFKLLRYLGCEIEINTKPVFDQKALSLSSVIINVPKKLKNTAPYELVRKMRASILCLGPLLARCYQARVSLPGGCAIGLRPVNYHIEGLQALGVNLNLLDGYIEASSKGFLTGSNIDLKFPSVGATENIIMAAVLAQGNTCINNAALEPEVLDLIAYLQKMGADISFSALSEKNKIKKNKIIINGVESLKPSFHKVIPDRIEAGTFLIAAAMTGGNLHLHNVKANHLFGLLEKLKQSGCTIQVDKAKGAIATVNAATAADDVGTATVNATAAADVDDATDQIYLSSDKLLTAVDIKTAVYPGFPTDLQAQWMAMMTQAQSPSLVEETIFENRFMHIPELNRLGASIKVNKSTAFISGPSPLKAASVMATDLRAGSSLVLAGLVASGETRINRIYHLDRGYEFLNHKLSSIGGLIKRQQTGPH